MAALAQLEKGYSRPCLHTVRSEGNRMTQRDAAEGARFNEPCVYFSLGCIRNGGLRCDPAVEISKSAAA